MDRRKWERTLAHFQARARGYLVRGELLRARQDFEEIVEEIDGGLAHLRWVDAVVSVPHFTDAQRDPCPRLYGRASEASDPGPDVSASPRSPAAAPSGEREKAETEKDGSRSSLLSGSVRVNREGQSTVGIKDGGATESAEESSITWTSLESDVNYSHSSKGPRQYHLAQDEPRTPEALRLHRNTLTMELVWLQQAIDSRKKYLSLKNRLSVS